MKSNWLMGILSAFIGAALVSCGGGGDTQVAGGGIGGTGISQGSITEYGSIWVNGVRFNTDTATISLDGSSGVAADLQLGMVVTVNGSINADGISGTADSVSYEKVLEGPIDGPVGTSSFTVLGQTVIVNGLTRFAPAPSVADISDLVEGNVIEVSGFIDETGNIRATYIEKTAEVFVSGQDVQVRGRVNNLIANVGFSIGSQAIDATTHGTDGLSDDDFVQVVGHYDNVTLFATDIERQPQSLGTDAEQVEIEGYATSAVDGANEFTVGLQRVRLASTVFEGGGSAAEILPGVKLEVEGILQNGILIAEEISFEGGIELEAYVSQVNGSDMTLTGLDGITVSFATAPADVMAKFLATNFDAKYVKLRGRHQAPSTVLVTKLEVEDAGEEVSVEAPVEAYSSAGSVTLLGVEFDVSNVTNFEGGAIVDLAGFFAWLETLQTLPVIELERSVNASSWTTIELED